MTSAPSPKGTERPVDVRLVRTEAERRHFKWQMSLL